MRFIVENSSLKTVLRLIFFSIFLFFFCTVRANATTIVLDPGHGGYGSNHSGAVYPPFVEKNLNFAVASELKAELEDAGITVYMTRQSDDEGLGLEERAAIASSVGADLLISLHFNSSGPHDKYGSEVWTSLYSPYFDTGVMLGSSILSKLSELGFASKGVKTRSGSNGDYYGIIRNGVKYGIPTIIVEHCFIDSAIDRPLLDSVGVSSLAHADAEGIIQFVYGMDASEVSQISQRHAVGGNDAPSEERYSRRTYVDKSRNRTSSEESSSKKSSSSSSKTQEEIDELRRARDEEIKKNTPSVSHSTSNSKTMVHNDD